MKKENNNKWELEIVNLDIAGNKKPVKVQDQEADILDHLVEMTSGKEHTANRLLQEIGENLLTFQQRKQMLEMICDLVS